MNLAPEPPKPHAIESFVVVLVVAALFCATVAFVLDAY